MKKGLLVTLDFWPQRGGVAAYYLGLLENTHSFSLSVLTQMTEEKPLSSQPLINIFRRTFFFKYFWPQWMRLLWELWRLHTKHSFDFFLVGDILPVGTVLFIFSYFTRKPYFVFIHGTDIVLSTRSLFKKFLSKKILARSEGIFVNSQATRNCVTKLSLFQEKIFILYPALSEKIFSASLHTTAKDLKCPIFLSIARLVERKGIHLILSALGNLKKENIFESFHYVIIGDGPEKTKIIQKIQEENLKNEVTLLDGASDETKWDWLSRASLFLLTPYQPFLWRGIKDHEGFGIVYLEAQAFGVPIIASLTGGISEAVIDGETGILVKNPQNIFEIVHAIKALFFDKQLLQKFSDNGKIQAKKFSWQKQVNEFEKILENNLFVE